MVSATNSSSSALCARVERVEYIGVGGAPSLDGQCSQIRDARHLVVAQSGGLAMRSLSQFLFRSGVALCASVGWLAVAQAAETKGPVTDDIGVLVIPKGAPVQIGGYWVLSGADAALGLDQKRAVEIAVKEKKTLAGHPIKFSAEDSLCNAEGGQTAATKLAANPNLAILIGP